jgi:hypothetical protein
MDLLGYIYEACRFTPADLDFVDTVFLQEIANGRLTTAYKIWNWNRKKSRDTSVDMAYKNVHRRVQGLLSQRLINEVAAPGGFKHGAKNFALTDRGLIYLYSILWGAKNIVETIKSHKNSALFQTFVYPFFETKTINNATLTLNLLLENFIISCCQSTVTCSRLLNNYIELLEDVKSKDELLGILPINYLYYKLNSDILLFLIKCVLSVTLFEDWEEYERVGVTNKVWGQESVDQSKLVSLLNDEKLQTYRMLVNDKKFMKALKTVEKDFIPSLDKLRMMEKASSR